MPHPADTPDRVPIGEGADHLPLTPENDNVSPPIVNEQPSPLLPVFNPESPHNLDITLSDEALLEVIQNVKFKKKKSIVKWIINRFLPKLVITPQHPKPPNHILAQNSWKEVVIAVILFSRLPLSTQRHEAVKAKRYSGIAEGKKYRVILKALSKNRDLAFRYNNGNGSRSATLRRVNEERRRKRQADDRVEVVPDHDVDVGSITTEKRNNLMDKRNNPSFKRRKTNDRVEEEEVVPDRVGLGSTTTEKRNDLMNKRNNPSFKRRKTNNGVEEEEVVPYQVGLGSTTKTRDDHLMDKRNNPSFKRRKFGSPPSSLATQSDVVAQRASDIAFATVARAQDTSEYLGRRSTDPTRRYLLIELNEVKNTNPSGGRPSAKNCAAPKKQLRTLASSEDDAREILTAYCQAVHGRNASDHDYESEFIVRRPDQKLHDTVTESNLKRRAM